MTSDTASLTGDSVEENEVDSRGLLLATGVVYTVNS